MSAAAPGPVVNLLLDALPPREYKGMMRGCEPIDLSFGTELCKPGQPYPYVYFPLTAFISLTATTDSQQSLEMGLIGNEGMLGAGLVLGIRTATLGAMVQGPGSALRMSAPKLLKDLQDSSALTRILSRYLHASIAQMLQTAVCTNFHEVRERLALWLLMLHDRAHADHFHLTHNFIADMLGVRRSAVTIAAGGLQRRKLIRYTRGEITILDRRGLEAAACNCYRAAR